MFGPRKLPSKRHSVYFSSVIMKKTEGWPLTSLDLYMDSVIKSLGKSSENKCFCMNSICNALKNESERFLFSKIRFRDFSDLQFPIMAPFWEGTVRRIGPRSRRRNSHWKIIYTSNESRVPALHVGMLTSFRECLDKKIQAFVHFSATFYVRIPGFLNRPYSRQWAAPLIPYFPS